MVSKERYELSVCVCCSEVVWLSVLVCLDVTGVTSVIVPISTEFVVMVVWLSVELLDEVSEVSSESDELLEVEELFGEWCEVGGEVVSTGGGLSSLTGVADETN